MRVLVVRSGGFAGITRRWEVDLDEAPDRDEWLALIETLPWNERPADPGGMDRFSYRIRCSRHQIVLPEGALTGPWRELVDRVQTVADGP